MKKLLLLYLCHLSMMAWSQAAVVIGPGKIQESNTFDEATIRCYYTFTQFDVKSNQPLRIDTMALDIGSKLSKFYNPTKLQRDLSVTNEMGKINPNTIQSISVLKGENSTDLSSYPGTTTSTSSNDGESYLIYKDRQTNTVTYIDYTGSINDTYQYEDKLENLAWNILPENSEVLGYPCQKATLNFRGRDYIAWFSADVPVNDGPWKFMGLPGLILKITDTKQLFSFELIGIEHPTTTIPIQIAEAKFKCSRKQFEEQKKKQGGGMQININGGNIIISESPGKYNYNPIELK